VIQAVLDFSAPKPKPPVTRGRAVDHVVAAALRRVLYRAHVGRESGATWEQLLGEVSREGVEVTIVRRLQEAASYLRRVEKVPVGGTSRDGIYIVVDDADRRLQVAERVKRIRAEAEEIAALDRSLYERIAPLLMAVDRRDP
jgi:hypothetical protein